MQEFSAESFFDLSEYPHKNLFQGDYVWDGLKNLQAYFENLPLGVHKGKISDKAYLVHPELITIEEGSVIEPGAYIRGPCYIGKRCIVRHGAYLREFVLLGDDCLVGHDTEVKHSIFFNRVCPAHFAYVGDSILGNFVNLGAGVKCANLRLDRKDICIRSKDRKISTNLKKLGSIIGDKVQIGCNVVLNPATFVGPESVCYPNITLKGIIKAASLVKVRESLIIESLEYA